MDAGAAQRVVEQVRTAAATDTAEEWLEREARNFARTREAPAAHAAADGFAERWHERSEANARDYLRRTREESGWRSHANPTAQWCGRATGDPDAYAVADLGVRRQRVAFHDRDGARLSGHCWRPADAAPGDDLPGVVLVGGSGRLPETPYWWFARRLAAEGYLVLSFEPRGHGRSDADAPPTGAGAPDDPPVYVAELVDAVDLLRSTPDEPYVPNVGRTDVAAPVPGRYPHHELLDRNRVGLVGHGLGAVAAAVVQGTDWPTGGPNPVDAIVAWDNLPAAGTTLGDHVVTPRVPAMAQAGDYAVAPQPKRCPPAPGARTRGVRDWLDADVPAAGLVVRGGTHYEWARVPTLPATEWTPGGGTAGDRSVAWLDRWLKRPGEPGYDDADDRLLAPLPPVDTSFHYRSPRGFPDRDGTWQETVRQGTPFPGDAPLSGTAVDPGSGFDAPADD